MAISESAYRELEKTIRRLENEITVLRKAKNPYLHLFKDHPGIVLCIDAHGERILDANQAAADFYGYGIEELKKKKLSQINIGSSWLSNFKNPDSEPLKSFQGDYRLTISDGSFRDVKITFTRDLLNQKDVYFAFIQDVTEYLRAEEGLRSSEEKFSGAFLESPAGMTITRVSDGTFTDANESFCKMFGYRREEVIGHTSTELNLWTVEERMKIIEAQKKTGGLNNFELTALSKSGQAIHILFSSRLLMIHKEPHLITTMIDITDRKQMEEKLKRSEFSLSESQKLANIGSWEFEVGMGYEFWSENLYRMFGFEPGDGIPETTEFLERIHPDDRQMVIKALQKMKKGEVPELTEFRSNPILLALKFFTHKWSVVRDGDGNATRYYGKIRDITENRKNEQELFQSGKRFITMFRNSIVGTIINLLIRDDKGKAVDYLYMDVNEATEKHLGIQPGNMKGHRASEFLSENLDFMLDLNEKLADSGKSYNIQKYFREYQRTIEVRAFQLEGDFFVSTFFDISESIKSQQLLLSSENQFRALVEQSISGIYTFSKDRFHYVNDKFCEIFGYSKEEILTRLKPTDVVESQDRETAQRNIDDRMSGKVDSIHYIAKGKRKDKRELWIEIHGSHLYLDGEHVITGTVLDITSRYQAVKNLEDSEQKFRSVFEASNIGKSITLPTGEIQVNQAFCDMLGYSEEELRNRKWQDITPVEDIPFVQENLNPLLEGNKSSARFTKRYLHKNGSHIWADVSVAILRNQENKPQFFITTVVDITERVLAEKKLEESEEKYRLLFDKMLDGFALHEIICNPEGRPVDYRFLEANNAFERITGLKLKDLIGKTIREMMPDIEDFWVDIYGKVAKDGEPVEFENYSGVLDKYFHISAFRPKPGLFATIFTDVTEQTRAETALRESEERLRLSTELARVAVWEFDFRTNSMSRSDNHDGLYGLNRQEVWKFETFVNATHPDDREFSNATIARSAAPGGPDKYEFDFRVLYPDQSVHWLMVNGQVIVRDEKGAGQIVRGTLMDITNRKQTENELRESEFQKRIILKTAMDGFWMTDLEGCLLQVNDAYCRMSGYSEEELLTMTIMDVEAIESKSEIRARIWKLVEQGNSRFETRHRRKDGTLFDVEIAIKYEPFGAGILVAFLHDITERKQHEEEIKKFNRELEERVNIRTEQLTAKNKELETFTYSVSHDLKAPLRGIDGYSQILVNEYHEKLDEEGKRFLNTIRESALQMNQLINDLLEYSRLERKSIKYSPLSLNDLIDSVLSFKLQDKKYSHYKIIRDIPEMEIIADREGLSLILRNLLENAYKFCQHSQDPSIEIGYRDTGQMHVIFVKDNGIGFEMKFHDRIFQIFQRLQRSEDYEGTGIGLAMVKKAVEQMKGRVWAESTSGKGAVFYIEIPKHNNILKYES